MSGLEIAGYTIGGLVLLDLAIAKYITYFVDYYWWDKDRPSAQKTESKTIIDESKLDREIENIIKRDNIESFANLCTISSNIKELPKYFLKNDGEKTHLIIEDESLAYASYLIKNVLEISATFNKTKLVDAVFDKSNRIGKFFNSTGATKYFIENASSKYINKLVKMASIQKSNDFINKMETIFNIDYKECRNQIVEIAITNGNIEMYSKVKGFLYTEDNINHLTNLVERYASLDNSTVSEERKAIRKIISNDIAGYKAK